MVTKATFELLRACLTIAACTTICAGAQLQVDEPPGPGEGFPDPYRVTGPVFTFSAALAISDFPPCFVGTTEVQFCHFLNDSGQDWNTLEIRITPGTEPVGCLLDFAFDNCDRQQGTGTSPTVLTLYGGSGIPQGEILALSGLDWSSETTFVVTANPEQVVIPEPGSIALSLFGIAAIVALQRRAHVRMET
jgi:hypothetical protein